ncbi:tetraspanin-7-like [Saccostrea cucullata]|uniref:tetraspanin-7-like n=1 Tax=Saccostrea cuccullata TaxID=36930 RepID=UPI002ED5DD99
MGCRSESGVRCLRIFVITDAILIWLIGGAIFGFSLWLLVDFFVNEYQAASDDLKQSKYVIYVFVAAGGFMVVYSLIGIIGAIKPNWKCLLIIYLICLVLSMLVLIGGTVWCYVYRYEIEIKLKNTFVTIVPNNYGKNTVVTRALDFMQSELECCGGQGYTDYKGSDWSNNLQIGGNIGYTQDNYAPLSCCTYYDRNKETQDTSYQACPICLDQLSGQNPLICSSVNPQIWKTPCNEAVVKFFKDNLGIAAGVAIGVLACQLFGVILASVLLHLYNSRYTPYDANNDDVVYEMARCQEKSPYPTRGAGPYANLYNN